MSATSSLTVLCPLLLALLVTGEVTQEESQKAAAFKEKFLRFSKECASQYDTTLVEVMPLFVKNDEEKSKVMCYLHCMLEKYNMMNRNGAYNNESFKRFVDSIPESRFKNTIQGNAKKCTQEGSQERCIKAYKFIKCFYTNGAGKNVPAK